VNRNIHKLVADFPDSADTAARLTAARAAHPSLRFQSDAPTYFHAHVFSSERVAHVRSFYVHAKSSAEAEQLVAHAYPDMNTIAVEIIDYVPVGRVIRRNDVPLLQEMMR
jgi:hypothetical protein